MQAKLKPFTVLAVLIAVSPAIGVADCTDCSSGLDGFSEAARVNLEKRIRAALSEKSDEYVVEGSVTGAGLRHFFIQNGGDALKVFCEDADLPHPGETVRVRGRPSLEGGRVVMTAHQWNKTGVSSMPKPRTATPNELLNATSRGGVNWMRVEISGRALERTENGFVIDVDGLPVTAHSLRLPSFLDDCGKTRPKVRVRGVAELVLDQSVLFGNAPWVMGVKLQLNGPEDVTLDPDAIYLMNIRDRRMMMAAAAAFVLLGAGIIVFIWVIFRQRRRNFRTQTLMAERKRMADDIHDTIEQHLVGAGMLLQLNRNKEARDVLLRAKSELRDIIWGLKNDDMMRLTPAEMLRATAEAATRKGIFRVTTRLVGMPDAMPAQDMRDLSLIVREAIGNAVKHGSARKIAITSDPLPKGGWLLRIANDGTPFNPATAPGAADGHFGLEGMRERARRIGTDISISVKNGWTVVAIEKGNSGKGGV